MLAQLKTVVLIKEAIQLAFFRLVEYLEHQHLWVRLQPQNGQKQRLSSETRQSILVIVSIRTRKCRLYRNNNTQVEHLSTK